MSYPRVTRSAAAKKNRLLSAILTYLPGAWINPSPRDLIALYQLRYRMAMDDKKYDSALIFLNKILEVDPLNLEAKLSKADLYHRHLNDYNSAVEQYTKVIKLTANRQNDAVRTRARNSMEELIDLLS